MIDIRIAQDDDPEFIIWVRDVVRGLASSQSPYAVYLVRIRDWFGAKWLGFAGKYQGWTAPRPETLQLPPFVPNRIMGQAWFVQDASGAYRWIGQGVPLLSPEGGGKSPDRLAARIVPGRAVVWFGGGTSDIDRASVMCYLPTDEEYWCWYAGLVRRDEWRVCEAHGITARELDELRSEGRSTV